MDISHPGCCDRPVEIRCTAPPRPVPNKHGSRPDWPVRRETPSIPIFRKSYPSRSVTAALWLDLARFALESTSLAILIAFPGLSGDSRAAGHFGWFRANAYRITPLSHDIASAGAIDLAIVLSPHLDPLLGGWAADWTFPAIVLEETDTEGNPTRAVMLRDVAIGGYDPTGGLRLTYTSLATADWQPDGMSGKWVGPG